VQVNPSPVNPSLHSHVYDPSVSEQVALTVTDHIHANVILVIPEMDSHATTLTNVPVVMDVTPMPLALTPKDHTHANVTMGSLEMDSLAQTSKTVTTIH
jgi:hypothetical protein